MNVKRKTTPTALVIAAWAVGLATIGGAGLATTSMAHEAQAARGEEAERAKVIAIKFHADWCGYCKAMGPVFEELQAKHDQESVLFIELDQTREFGRRQSAYMAHALGLDRVWEEHGGGTGFILLIDAQTKSVVQRLSHEQGLKQMGAALQQAVRNAS